MDVRMMKASGDKDCMASAKAKVQQKTAAYKEYCDKTGLTVKADRLTVQGYRAKADSSKTLDKSGGSGIIRVGSENVALEYQRYGRNKDTLVNKTYIDSGEYRKKFDKLTDNPEVNKSLYECAKKALKHRSGTEFEDMYWIDGESGNILLSVTDSTDERAIVYSDRIKNAIKDYDNAITLHTHPSSMPPSISDLNSCCKNNYSMGIVACHNGKIFGYTSKEYVNESIYSMYIQRYIKDGDDEYNAQLKALERLSQSFDINIREVT
jgi:proteasome lid subunit RPN8/RPN11